MCLLFHLYSKVINHFKNSIVFDKAKKHWEQFPFHVLLVKLKYFPYVDFLIVFYELSVILVFFYFIDILNIIFSSSVL